MSLLFSVAVYVVQMLKMNKFRRSNHGGLAMWLWLTIPHSILEICKEGHLKCLHIFFVNYMKAVRGLLNTVDIWEE